MTYSPSAPSRFSLSVMADNVMLIGESFVSKASVAGDEHAALTWGAAQAGVGCGAADAAAPYFAPAVAAPARP